MDNCPRYTAAIVPTDLSVPKLLFCVANDTEWERAGVTVMIAA
jgi:hypothetical protein